MLIQSHTFDGRQDGPHLLITAGVHGDEREPADAVRQLAESVRADALTGRLTLVPVVNESAFQRNSRAGKDGLDLARICPGRSDGTLTERIANELTQLLRSADYYVDLHTGGTKMQIWPMAGYMLHENVHVLEKQRALARAFNLPVVWGTSPRLDGRTLSVARDLNIPAIYAEYLGSATFCREAITSLVEGCLNVMSHLAMIARTQPVSRVRFFAEEVEGASGHLQICHPAPESGEFEPTVELGAAVSAGDCIGHLSSDEKHGLTPIRAEKTGRVLALTNRGRVDKGDGLGVVVQFQD